MAERIEGLSIGLDLDSLKVERGLTGLKDRLKTVNSEMKSNMSAFDRSDKSIGKYETRLKGLNKKLEVQKQATQAAKEEYDKLIEEGKAGTKEAEKAERAYNNQAAALNNLERYIDGVSKELEEMREKQRIAESGWGKLSKKMESGGASLTNIGDKMTTVGKTWSKFSAVIAGGAAAAGGGLLALTNKVTENADAIAKGAERAGVSTKMYQELDFWASQNGISHEKMEKMVGRFNQRMGQAQNGNEKYSNALQQLGVDMEGVRNGTISTDDAFSQSIKTLSGMANEQDKINLATEMFGTRMARDMLPALNEGSLTLEEAKKMAEEYGLVMSQDQLEQAEAFQDAQDQIKRSLGMVVNEIGLELMPHFQKMFDWILANMPQIKETISNAFDIVASKISELVKWFSGLDPPMQKAIAGFSGLSLAMGPILFVGGKLTSLFGGLLTKLAPLAKDIAKAGGLLKYLRGAFVALTGPVGITIGVLTALGTGLTVAYNKSETFRNAVNKIKDSFLNAVQGIYQFLTTNEQILAFVDGVKNAFNTMRQKVNQAIGAIVSFFKEKIAQMREFWDSEGAGITQAFMVVFGKIKSIVSPVLNWLVAIFQKVFPLIKNILKIAFNTMLTIVKSVWGNIKGVINGGLQVIQGLIKTFSGLFTGDFSKMWEGIKDIFSGAIKFLWNFIQLTFFGRILKAAKGFSGVFKNIFSTVWSAIKKIFTTVIKFVVDFVKNSFSRMSRTTGNIMRGIQKILNTIWNKILSIIKSIVKGIFNFVKNIFTNLSNTISNIFSGIRNFTTKIWNGIKNRIVNPVKNAVSVAKDKFTGFKNSTLDLFRKTKDGVGDFVGKMIDGVKAMPGKMRDGIKKGAGKVKDGMVWLGKKMVSPLKGAVNGVISGINWILKKVNVDTIDKWTPKFSWYAHGTDGHPGGHAVLGDGKGSNSGSELTLLPNGKAFLSADKPTLYPDLPKGTQVIPAKQTKQIIPRYDRGVGSAASRVKDMNEMKKAKAPNVWDYLTEPKLLLNKTLRYLGVGVTKGSGIMLDMAKGAFKFVKKKSIDFIKDKLSFASSEGLNTFSGFTQTSGYGSRKDPFTGKTTFHKGIDFGGALGAIIKAVTGGKVAFSGFGRSGSGYGGYGNAVAINSGPYTHLYAHLQDALVKAGQSISAGQKIGKMGSTGQSTGVHLHYEVRKKGTMDTINPKKFLEGGSIPGGNVSGNVKKWINQAMARTGVSGGNWLKGLSYIIQRESSGNPRAVGAPTSTGTAKGLMQLKDFNINGNPFDPVNNISAGIKYIKGRYGSIGKAVDFWKKNNWYATGGLINQEGLYGLAEEGHPEIVIPTNPKRRTDAMKLLALAGKKLQGNKRPNQIPNVGGRDNNAIERLLDATIQQNEILMQLLKKDNNVYLDSDDITKRTNENNAVRASLSYF